MLETDLELPTASLIDERQEWNDVFLNDDQNIAIPFPDNDTVMNAPLPLLESNLEFTLRTMVSSHNMEVDLNGLTDATPLDIIQDYANRSIPSYRVIAANQIRSLLDKVSLQETIDTILPLFIDLALDPTPEVRQVMAKQLFPLVVYYYHHAPPRPDKDCTIPAIPLHSFSFIMIEWLLDQSNATSAFCQQNIMSLTLELMSDSYLLENEVVDGLILNLFALGQGIKRREPQQRRLVYTTYDDTLLDHGDMHLSKMACLHLVSALCPYLGADLCSKHCVPVLESFWNDSIFYVRKEVALTISSLAPHLDEDVLTQRLIPIFEQLCKDATWHVRHNSLIALPTLCDLVSHDLKVRLVGPCVQRFMNDLSQQVRFKLAELIGALIVKFLPKDWESSRAPGNVPAPLVEFFLSLGNQSRHEPGQHRLEDDMVLLCAFNFPAALLTVGASAWDTEFKDVYMKLAKDHQVKVRTSLAHSLHEISRILGPEKTERDLVHIFALYLMDVDQVKACVLDHLAAFLQGLPDHSRQEYLPVLSEIWEGLDDNYRLREVFTEQLDACLVFCSLDQIIDQILPLTAQATKDSIAIIRNNAAILIHHIVQIFHDHVDQFDKSMAILIDHIHTLTTSSQYHHRLLYVTICQHLISAEDLTLETWAKWLTPGLFPLVKDPVVNVRAAMARLVSTLHGRGYCHSDIDIAVQQLQADPEHDVSSPVHGLSCQKKVVDPTSELPSPPYSMEEKVSI